MKKTTRYVDKNSIRYVLGNLIKKPSLLEEGDKYTFNSEDFVEPFHKMLFGVINNLKAQGAKKFDLVDIDNYLTERPSLYKLYNDNKGAEYLVEASKVAELQTFDFYYGRMKKMTLLRMYDNYGIDVSFIYNPDNILDIALKQKQEDWIDNNTLEAIAFAVDERIEEIKAGYVNSTDNESVNAGAGIFDLIERLKVTPEVGIPLYGPLVNTITRGARLKKFYLRSAPTGVGKSRTMAADICNFACDEIYDLTLKKWIKNGTKEPATYIVTELEVEEVQTMMLAFLSGVQEENILNGEYNDGEEERVKYAAKLLQESPLAIVELPDFSLRDIENIIRREVRDRDARYVCFDYIHTSLKILEEITKRTGGVKLREDNILFMLSIRLKDLCNELGIFIMSATQLNGDWQDAKEANQNLLRGAKAIADKIDLGSIMLPVKEEDLKMLEPILACGLPTPNMVESFYKNRRGKFKSVKLWCVSDMGTCRKTPIFLTDNNYNLIPIEDMDIIVEKAMPQQEESAF